MPPHWRPWPEVEPGLGPTIQNVDGTIAAVGAAAVVAFGGVVSGGRLSSSGGGRILALGSLPRLAGEQLCFSFCLRCGDLTEVATVLGAVNDAMRRLWRWPAAIIDSPCARRLG
jgi:hypothetical protein